MEILWTEGLFHAKLFLPCLVLNFCIPITFLCHVVSNIIVSILETILTSDLYIAALCNSRWLVLWSTDCHPLKLYFQAIMKPVLWIKCMVLRERSSLNILFFHGIDIVVHVWIYFTSKLSLVEEFLNRSNIFFRYGWTFYRSLQLATIGSSYQ